MLDHVNDSHPQDKPVADIGPLAWVFDELRKSLDSANKAIRRFLRETEQSRDHDLEAVDPNALLTLSLRDPALIGRAKAWRHKVEQAIAARLDVSAKAKETAALIFAAWQGRMLWDAGGGKGFRLGDAIKRLG